MLTPRTIATLGAALAATVALTLTAVTPFADADPIVIGGPIGSPDPVVPDVPVLPENPTPCQQGCWDDYRQRLLDAELDYAARLAILLAVMNTQINEANERHLQRVANCLTSACVAASAATRDAEVQAIIDWYNSEKALLDQEYADLGDLIEDLFHDCMNLCDILGTGGPGNVPPALVGGG